MIRTKRSKAKWTEAEKAFLRKNAEKLKDEDIADKLRRSVKSVREMRRRLGVIKKSGRGLSEIDVEKKKQRRSYK